MKDWISVKDRLPEKGIDVLVCEMKFEHKYPNIGIGELDQEGNWWYSIGEEIQKEDYDQDYRSITHWMPLPEPPKPSES